MKKVWNILRNDWEIVIVVILLIVMIIYGVMHPNQEQVDDKVIIEKESVILIGDNLIENYNLSEYTDLFEYEKISFKEAETTSILLKVEEFDKSKFNSAIIYIGVYDIIMGNDENTIYNIKEIINNLEDINNIYIIPILNTNYDKGNKYIKRISNEKINNMNEDIEELCSEIKKVKYLNIEDLLDDKELSKEYTNDGFNLNEDGYKVLTDIIKEAY